jgi:probable blue pigment (indigoidine) exporter
MTGRPALAFAGCVAIWSLTWVAVAAGATGAAPIGNGGLRALLAAGILALLAVAWRAPRPSRPQALRLAGAGLVFVGVNFALVYSAAPRLPGSSAALLYATLPLQSALLGPLLVASERVEARVVAGALLGAAGVGLALRQGLAGSGWPVAAVLLAATASAVGAGLLRRVAGVHPLWVNAWANLGGAVGLVAAWLALERTSPLPAGALGWGGFLYMLLGGSVVAFLLYLGLLRTWSTARVAYASLAASGGAVAVGVALGEPFGAWQAAGLALVAGGGALVLRRPPASAGRPRPAVGSPTPSAAPPHRAGSDPPR